LSATFLTDDDDDDFDDESLQDDPDMRCMKPPDDLSFVEPLLLLGRAAMVG
jgi:hypothetical protein